MFFVEMSTVFKIIVVFNMVFAFIWLSSALATAYQQYLAYMETMELFREEKMDELNKKEDTEEETKDDEEEEWDEG